MEKIQHINQLLEKYWEGETTLAEEKTLQTFFASDEIPLELQAFQSLFQAKTEAQQPQLSADFDTQLLAMLDTEEKQETKIIQLQQTQSAELRRWRWIAGIAASIALILAVYVAIPKANITEIAATEKLNETEHKQALKAYEQTRAALLFVSAKMNHGTQTAAKGLSKVSNLEEVMNAIAE